MTIAQSPYPEDKKKKYGVEILCIGTEILLGNIINTNARWLAEELSSLGLSHYRQSVVGDNLERLQGAIIDISNRSRILITTGGLGPTPDDLTTQAIATAFNAPLEERAEILIDIKEKLATNKCAFVESNRKQALIPCGAEVIPNPIGTAPGIIWSPKPGFTLMTFPGVPSELKEMWINSAVPWLQANEGTNQVLVSKVLRFTGISESALAEQIHDLLQIRNPTVAPYAELGEVKLRITAKEANRTKANQLITPIESELRLRTGLQLYGYESDSLASVVLELLRKRGQSMSVAESCTGGGIGAALTAIPGASEAFIGGVIVYTNLMKESLLDIPAQMLITHGAVSAPVAQAMAKGAREKFQSDWGIAVTGIAGPAGGTQSKPIGLVHFAVAGPHICSSTSENFGTHRKRGDIQRLSVIRALNQLRILLLARG